ncbi:hypothetical protein Cgig2_029031 [Carnegiea gigantea]|uniref:Uncharacterized protein n=1 Tax=Carnegiea gigantea TaxID=171969 RepID=A0A9Q1Q7D1_9CARY|nr:hypothetical protein Cgig2_029031 [Carnegiea gigantea]
MKHFQRSPCVASGLFQAATWPSSTTQPPWFCPWCFSCNSWLQLIASLQQLSTPFQGLIGRCRFMSSGNYNVRHTKRTFRVSTGRGPVPNQKPVVEALGNNSKVFSIFIDNLPKDLNTSNFKDLLNSIKEVLDAHIPDKFGRTTGRKYGVTAIEHMNGKTVSYYKLHVMWVGFQKRLANRGRTGSTLLKEDIHERLSDNSKTIAQPLDSAHSARFTLGSFGPKYQVLITPFDGPLEMKLQLHMKSERCEHSSKGKKSDSKNSKSNHNSPTPTEIAKEALDFGGKLGISVMSDAISTIRRIIRSLIKELKNKRQTTYLHH